MDGEHYLRSRNIRVPGDCTSLCVTHFAALFINLLIKSAPINIYM